MINVRCSVSRKMPSSSQCCGHCGVRVAGRNLARHVRKNHTSVIKDQDSSGIGSEDQEQSTVSSRSASTKSRDSSVESRSRAHSSERGRSSSVKNTLNSTSGYQNSSADYMRDAVLCMLRRTSGVNAPNLMRYLGVHFPGIPEICRWPLILGTFTAAQRVALAYADVLMDADADRVSSAKKSLARWLHGLSAVEPGQAETEIVTQHDAATPRTSPDVDAYSPITNYLIPKNLPVRLDSQFGRDEMEAHFDAEATDSEQRQDLFGSTPQMISAQVEPAIVVNDDHQDVEPVSAAVVDSAQSLAVDGQLSGQIAPSDQAEVLVVLEEVTPIQSSEDDQIESGKQSNGPRVDEDQSGDHPSPEGQTRDLSDPMLAFSDLIKIHDVDALMYSDLTKPLIQLSPLRTPPVQLSPEKTGHDVNRKLDKRISDVGKVIRRKKDTTISSSGTAVNKAAERQSSDAANGAVKRANADHDQSAVSGSKRPKSVVSSESNKSSQVKSTVSSTNSGLKNFKIPLLPKENLPQLPHRRDDRPTVQDRCYQGRKENSFRRSDDYHGFRRFRPPPENRRYTLDRRSGYHRERDSVLSATERYWLSKIPPDLQLHL